MSMTGFSGQTDDIARPLPSVVDAAQTLLQSVRGRFGAIEHPRLFWLSLFAGGLLTLIGIRFLIVPESAAFTFGVGTSQSGSELHHIIGVRDIWLGALAVLFVLLREWRALAAWFLLAAGVCFYDAGIVFNSTANLWAIAFHCGSGVFCWKVGRACLKKH